jgi:ABC-type sugar transport system permease subunit
MMKEIDVQKFLQRIVWSVTLVIVYLVINFTFGLMFGWLFFEGSPVRGNYIYYAWVLASTIGVVYLLIKMWRVREED